MPSPDSWNHFITQTAKVARNAKSRRPAAPQAGNRARSIPLSEVFMPVSRDRHHRRKSARTAPAKFNAGCGVTSRIQNHRQRERATARPRQGNMALCARLPYSPFGARGWKRHRNHRQEHRHAQELGDSFAISSALPRAVARTDHLRATSLDGAAREDACLPVRELKPRATIG